MRSLVLGLAVFALGLAAAALVTSPGAGAHSTAGSLSASVGPGFTISMSSSSVTAGDYTISVDDKSAAHNFHLSGPGVDEATSITGTGSTSWSVTLQPGTYHFQCDAHASSMKGTLTVTAVTTTSTTVATSTTASTTTATTAHTTTAHTTTQETTAAAETTTVAAATTTTEPPATTAAATTTQAAAPKPLSTRIAAVRATPTVVTLTVSASAPGHAVAQLFSGAKRLAQASGAVPGTLRLRPAHTLKAGRRYVVKLRVSAGGATTSSQRTIRVSARP